jgi:putative lumazine-binding protein
MAVADATQTEIVGTALDYFEGWFDGDLGRMRRALHPELAKRALTEDGSTLDETTTEWMLDATAKQLGKTRDVPDRRIEVEVVDVYRDIATAVVRSAVYREYIHLVLTRDGWKIVNALWAWS